ncbi:MAG: hypothetical protein AB7N29_08920 [Vicinamibacterales bacterium]
MVVRGHDSGAVARPLLLAVCCLLFSGTGAVAQEAQSTGTDGFSFMPRFNFYLSAAALAHDDPRFAWDTHFGGDVDLLTFAGARVNALAEYEAVLGSEFRSFDPNQGNYTLEASVVRRVRHTELAAVVHHVSRHLSDRPKRFSVDWNTVAVRVRRQLAYSAIDIDIRATLGKVFKRSYVDYDWIGDLEVVARRQLRSGVGIFGRGMCIVYASDVGTQDRTRAGVRLEGGVRLGGGDGATELFAGYEHRVDAYPLQRSAEGWAFAGFRLVSR